KIISNGTRFGRLVVDGVSHLKKGRGYYYKCTCDCEKKVIVRGSNLRSGETKSCGCLHDELLRKNVKKYYAKNFIEDTNLALIQSETVSRSNTSGVKGVSWHKGSNKWVARIQFQKKTYNLGYYDKLEDAKQARKEAEEKLHDGFLERVKKNES
ncbi:MAG: AP2 domain-containing protein, partial [Eubacterium sp.]